MRFTCDSCQARYTIADEKVRGRLLRVRCKRCGSPILLKQDDFEEEPIPSNDDDATRILPSEEVQREVERAAARSTSKRASPAKRPRPPGGELPSWFFVRSGEEIGPFTRAELVAKIEAGEVQARTYVWRDGMGEWSRLRDVAELAALVPPAAPEPKIVTRADRERAAAAPDPAANQSASEQSAAEQNAASEQPEMERVGVEPNATVEDAERQQVASEEASADEQPERTSPAGAQEAVTDDRMAPEPTHDAAVSDVPAIRPELAALLDQLDDQADPSPLPPEPEPTPSGPVVGGAAAAKDDPFAQVPDAPSFQPPEPGETTNSIIRASGARERRWGGLVGGAFVVLLVGVGAVWVAFQQTDTPRLPEPAEPPKVVVAEASPQPVEQLDQASLDILSGEKSRREREQAEARARDAARRRQEEAALIPPDVDREGAIRSVRGDSRKLEATPEELALLATLQRDRRTGGPGASGPKRFVTDDTFDVKRTASGGEGGPDPVAVAKRIADARPGIESCISAALRRNPDQRLGKVVVTATVAPSGVVTNAVFNNRSISQSDLGACLRRTIKGIVFPGFEGEPTDIEIPLVLGAG